MYDKVIYIHIYIYTILYIYIYTPFFTGRFYCAVQFLAFLVFSNSLLPGPCQHDSSSRVFGLQQKRIQYVRRERVLVPHLLKSRAASQSVPGLGHGSFLGSSGVTHWATGMSEFKMLFKCWAGIDVMGTCWVWNIWWTFGVGDVSFISVEMDMILKLRGTRSLLIQRAFWQFFKVEESPKQNPGNVGVDELEIRLVQDGAPQIWSLVYKPWNNPH